MVFGFRTIGTSNYWTFGLSDLRTIGPSPKKTQASVITKSCYLQIRNIARIQSYTTEDACKTLVCSHVASRLDHGNALLYGVNTNRISKLQRVQNTAARLITRSKKHDHNYISSHVSSLASGAVSSPI